MSLSTSRGPHHEHSYRGFSAPRSRWGAHDHRRRSLRSALLLGAFMAAVAVALGFGLAEVSKPPPPVDTAGIYFDPGPPNLEAAQIEAPQGAPARMPPGEVEAPAIAAVSAEAPSSPVPPAAPVAAPPAPAAAGPLLTGTPAGARPAKPTAKAETAKPRALHAPGWPYARPAEASPQP